MTEEEFLSHIGHTPEDLETAKITVEELMAIHADHTQNFPILQDMGEATQRALGRFPGVHSTRVRVKTPQSLVRKIMRKRLDGPLKGEPIRDINATNYRNEVRDLIGLRAFHLFKEKWSPIHQAIDATWNYHPDEIPIAYLREGDSKELKADFEAAGFKVDYKDGGYRSLHFVISSQFGKFPTYMEIQVRTLFEEAWGEVDHEVRYPDHQKDPLLKDYLLILNRLAGGADEMSSLLLRVKQLQVHNQELAQAEVEQAQQIDTLQVQLSQIVNELNVAQDDKDKVMRKVDELKQKLDEASKYSLPVTNFIPDTSFIMSSLDTTSFTGLPSPTFSLALGLGVSPEIPTSTYRSPLTGKIYPGSTTMYLAGNTSLPPTPALPDTSLRLFGTGSHATYPSKTLEEIRKKYNIPPLLTDFKENKY